MVERGLAPTFSTDALAQLEKMREAPVETGGDVRDLRSLPWCSIDNDDSRDLDQVTAAEELEGGRIKVYVGVADVDVLVKKGTALDVQAATNTTSVYTAAEVFPMLPDRLSTDLTSVNPDVDRMALVFEYVVGADGAVADSEIYRACVTNRARLAYKSVSAWLEGDAAAPAALARVEGMDRQLRVQDQVAQRLRNRRHAAGALGFQSLESRPVFEGAHLVDLEVSESSRGTQLIEELMVAANGVSARFLEVNGRASLRRVVRSPERWAKIVEVAAEYDEVLPKQANSRALEVFLRRRRVADPVRFPDLSLTIVKLMGRGEYVAHVPGVHPIGHFGLSVDDYAHSTAPNRRFPDLITHRLLESTLAGKRPAYELAELAELATHCSAMESAATKVERHVRKSAGALLLEDRVGEAFDGIVTGATRRGTFVRIFSPPVEGRVMRGERGLTVGSRVRVELIRTDFDRGYLDFSRIA